MVVASVVGAVLAVRGRRRAGGVALVVGVLAFFAAPLIVTWAHVADRVLAHARSAVGLGSGPASRLPQGFIESPMHSSYGLAFVVLFIGAGVLVVDDVRRRRLPGAALVALVGVPSSVLLTALALAYDPQRMRYVAFSVALAATVFGTALRVRPGMDFGALTAVTLALSVAYFVPRPAGSRSSRRIELPAGPPAGSSRRRAAPETSRRSAFMAERIPPGRRSPSTSPQHVPLSRLGRRLRRTVLFVPAGGHVPEDAEWLVVGPSRPADERRLAAGGWALELSSSRGWRIFGVR